MIQNKKIAIFYILEILKEYTDEHHPLTQKQIGDKLLSIYGIDLERKSVAANLELLAEYLDLDINKNPGGGFYLGERNFDTTEIKFLTDAIFSSKIIDGKQAKELAKKISGDLSRYERKEYSYVYKSTEISRTDNAEFFYNIDIINEAINNHKKVSFQYLTYDKDGNLIPRNEGYRYVVSPYFMVNNFGKYYLICNYYKYNNHTNYRIDYIKDIRIEDSNIKPMGEVVSLGRNFDISKYINDHIYMFGGDIIEAKVEVIADFGIIHVKDWFGDSARIRKENGKTYAYIKTDDKALFYWALQYQEYVIVLEPYSLKQKIINTLGKSINNYSSEELVYDVDIISLIKEYFKEDISFRIGNIHSDEELKDDLLQYVKDNSPKSLKYYSKDNVNLVFDIKDKQYAIDIVYADGGNVKDKVQEVYDKFSDLKIKDKYENKYLLLLLHNEFISYNLNDNRFNDIANGRLNDYKLDMYAIPNTELKNHHKYTLLKL